MQDAHNSPDMPGERSLPTPAREIIARNTAARNTADRIISARVITARVIAASWVEARLIAVLGLCFVSFLQVVAVDARAQAPGGGEIVRPAGPVYDLVALRVEFQPDSSRFSTGEGTFDGQLFDVDEELQVDPLPHDAGYFAAHLNFLETYIERVSDGRTQVQTHLLPVVRVSGPMADYAPIGQDSDAPEQIARLAALVEEAWTIAEAQGISLPDGLSPQTTAFAIFHAGVGRDVDLLGTTLDKTPEDLPSIFFSEDALRQHLAAVPTINGFDVSNTMIIPRTESRQGVNPITDEPFVLGLSINGLLAASFLNYLGVPDLFDTETGRSAIGPFGVMDALGIFALNGLFPPEPSAWTKQFLGWADVRVQSDDSVEIQYTGHPELNEAIRVPISDAEYFLIENRHRDPESDGVVLTVYRDGSLVEERFENGDPDFNDQTIDGFGGGVVVDVDNYDFALPGGIDENDNPLVGGALIWHVDENRLRAGLAENSVNVGPEHRAVDLEEADGAQDIGYPSTSDFGPQFELGTPFDFWFEGNPVSVVTQTAGTVRLYENRFGADTVPPAATNAGGRSFVEIADFSGAGPVMTLTVRPADGGALRPVHVQGANLDLDVTDFGVLQLADAADPSAFRVFGDGTLYFPDPSGGGSVGRSRLLSAVPVFEEGRAVAVDEQGFVIRVADGDDATMPFPDGLVIDRAFGAVVKRGDRYEVPVLVDQTRRLLTSDGSTGGVPDGLLARLFAEDATGAAVDGWVERSRAVLGSLEWTFDPLTAADEWPSAPQGSAGQEPVHVAAGRDEAGLLVAVVSPLDGRLLLLAEDASGARHVTDRTLSSISGSTCRPSAPVAADIDADSRVDIVLACGNHLVAFHSSGAIASGFPIEASATFSSPPAVVFDADDRVSAILAATTAGSVDGYRPGGRRSRIAGFPLPAGVISSVAPDAVGGLLGTLSGAGDLRFFTSDRPDDWTRAVGPWDAANNRRFVRIEQSGGGPGNDTDELLVASETYNWPNPIRDGRTFVRFELSQSADVTITIVDLAGSLVDRITERDAPAGVPIDIEWTTDAVSGVYLARVEAVADGRTESRLIKMAVIR